MGSVEVEVRTVDGSGWVRAVGDTAATVGAWFTEHAMVVSLVVVGVLGTWWLLRALTRGGVSGR